MDNALGDDTPMVTADSRGGARLATEHLLDLATARSGTSPDRPAGPPPNAGPRAGARPWRRPGPRCPSRSSATGARDSGYDLGRRLARRPDVTAVFASNDQMALGVLRALHEAGRRVPDDVSVVGYDDIPEAAHLLPPLTTDPHRLPEIGTRSLRLLLARIDGRADTGTKAETDLVTVIPAHLIVRRSTGPAPGRP